MYTYPGNGYFTQVYVIYCSIIYTVVRVSMKIVYSYYHASLNHQKILQGGVDGGGGGVCVCACVCLRGGGGVQARLPENSSDNVF